MTSVASLPSKWGPPIHNQQRQLWQEGAKGITDIPVSLEGHSLGTGSSELSEAITYTNTVRRNGRIIPLTKTLRSAIEMAITYDFGIEATLWSPVMQDSFTGCIRTFFVEYVCPEDSEYAHFIILERGAMTPAIETIDLIVNEDTGEAVRWTTSIVVERRLWGWDLAYRQEYAAGGSNGLFDVDFVLEDCPGCDGNLGLDLMAVGGDVAVLPTVVNTDDRFESVISGTTGAIGDIAYTSYADGDLQLVCVGDNVDPSAATSALVYRSINRGVDFTALTDIDIIVYDFIKVGSDILAVGVTTGGAAAVQISTDNGGSFTELTSTVLPASEALLSAAYDPDKQKIYFGGASGSLLTGRLGIAGMHLTDITANLATTAPSIINEVVYLDTDNIVVVGDSGIVQETWDGAETFNVIPFPVATEITAADGNKYRLVLGSGVNVYERSFLTKNRIEIAPLAEGVVLTGNITAIAMNTEDDFNRFAVCTDDGEVALGIPKYPNA